MERAFRTLGLPPQASLNEAKQRFRELALSHHPNKNIGDDNGVLLDFLSIYAAFKTVEASFGKTPRWIAEPYVDPTGLVRDLYDRRCLCEYCFFSRSRGKFAVHDRSGLRNPPKADAKTSEAMQRAVTSMLVSMVKPEGPQHPATVDLAVQGDLALSELLYVMASISIVFDTVVRQALGAEVQTERAEKWWTWREGWPLHPFHDRPNDASSFGELLPLTEADFPTTSLSATLNFCVMLMSEYTRFEQGRLFQRRECFPETPDDARLTLLRDETRAWSALLGALLAVEQVASALMQKEVRDVAIQGLVGTMLAYVNP